ncbi:GTA-gp10 family protein [uncultured Hyphomonas sp.]|uniref:GTA-gp10 family protein n=1 Tax=uncultured Hyphomonas sp. TaxID=225298 RepID=UPI002AAA88F0|nr:GTA-gp10 family protein [uncultured Hyphomonas sp.]
MNAARGETSLMIGGEARRLCLTLGALAEIEAAFGCKRMAELDARLRSLSAADLTLVLAALLRGGGEDQTAAGLGSADVSPGAAARAVAEAFRLGLAA